MARGDIYDVEDIRTLSQNFGLKDRQIAEKLGCDRATVTRLRQRHSIPTCNLRSRYDKPYVCADCGTIITTRSKDKCKAFCNSCEEKNLNKFYKVVRVVGIFRANRNKNCLLPSLSD